ncbi:hypothetical protein RQP46_001707 [Phenoliferia psychrophenolica]
MGDSRSPFHDEPIDSIFLDRVRHPQQQHQHDSNSSQSRSPTRSPPARRRRMPTSMTATAAGLGMGSSGIGNRSLMGLLGGTRYEPMGFDGLRVGADVLEEGPGDEDSVASGMQHPDDHARGRGGARLSDAQLAASLPPPPSAMSPSDATDSENDDDEDDPPPDFTSHAPASPTRRRKHPTTASIPSGGWGGLRLGGGPVGGILGSPRSAGMGARERALWRWVNVEDLDYFLQEVYLYYVGKGVWAIALSRLLNLLTVGWVIFFSTFLLGCIDYTVLWDSHHLSEVVVDHCVSRFSGLTFVLVVSFSSFYFWRVVRFGMGVRQLWGMHEFYAELLEVPENDIQTIPWHNIVSRLSELRATHPSALSSTHDPGSTAHRLDAHDVANRIMREENYLIALINKDVLDLSVPVPEFVQRFAPRAVGYGATMLTRTLEWNLAFCLTGFLFGQDGQVRKAFVSDRNKVELTEALKRRFILMGLINAAFAPFILLYLMMYSFFRYFEEYHKNPSSIGSRQFTQLARWKFREFNELPHLFQQRLNHAYPIAEQYVNQFPKEKTALVSRFVAFLAGSFAAVLILFSLIDPDAFLHFEITPGRTVLFYITLFGGILAVARGMVPDENRVVDPEETMREIVEHTHYLPVEWRGKLHSAEVHLAFGQLFQMKVALFVQELLSVIVTPFVLWYTLPKCAGPVVDFFREFTVHVDNLGYVCSFAVFDFKRHGDTRFGAPVEAADVGDRYKSQQGKMEKSFLNFTAQNPAWVPRDQTQSLFLSTLGAAPIIPSPLNNSNANLHPHPRGFPDRSAFPSARSTSRSKRFPHHAPPTAFATDAIAEKGKKYDLAFQRSTMGSSIATASGSAGRLRPGLVVPRPLPPRERAIDEESGLDGDSYIATTQEQPWGAPREDEETSAEGRESERVPGTAGIGGLLSEMYDISGKQW